MPYQNNNPAEKQNYSLLRFLAHYIKPQVSNLIMSIVCVLISSASILGLGLGIEYFVNTPKDKIWLEIAAFFCIFTGAICVSIFGRIYFVNLGGQRIIARMRKDVSTHLVQRSPEFFEHHKLGNLVSIVTADISVIENFIAGGFTVMLRHSLTMLSSLFMVFYSNLSLAIDVLLFIPLLLLTKVVIGNRVRKLSSNCRASIGDLGSCFEDIISNLKLIQSFSGEDKVIQKFSAQSYKCSELFIKYSIYKAIFIVLIILSILSTVSLVMWGGLTQLGANLVDNGALLSFLFYVLMAAGGLSGISDGLNDLQQTTSSLHRIASLLSDNSGMPSAKLPSARIIGMPTVHSITFEKVDFSYPSRKNNKILDEFCLEIQKGETVALVGRSGEGKSTVFNLLMRFYAVNSGEIKINETDISHLPLMHLRQIFGWVPQENVLITDSLYANLCLGSEQITYNEVMEVLSQVEMLDFINSLPNGLDTMVGERGCNFSGGQKQRLGIARALLRRPQVLLFDEATSSLDQASEAIIQNTIFNTCANSTKIIIAHRLSTIIRSDKIAVMENGKVVEIGNHEQLLNLGGLYSELLKANSYR